MTCFFRGLSINIMIFKATLQTVFYPKPNLLFSRSIPPRPNINIVISILPCQSLLPYQEFSWQTDIFISINKCCCGVKFEIIFLQLPLLTNECDNEVRKKSKRGIESRGSSHLFSHRPKHGWQTWQKRNTQIG